MRTGIARLVAIGAVLCAAWAGPAAAADPDALWKIVHGRCVPDQQTSHIPAPCISVDPDRGYAVLKDIRGATQFLLIPTAKITGIESPAILAPGAPNYFAAAWDATSLVDGQLHRTLPRPDFALAINALGGRTQNQLHIHVDCIDPAVRTALDQAMPAIGTAWHMLPMRLDGHEYRAIWLPGGMLGTTNPFRLLAGSLPDPAHDMAAHTLVLVGAERDGLPGFVLLDGKAGALAVALSSRIKLGAGSGEELEDHSCRIAATPAAAGPPGAPG